MPMPGIPHVSHVVQAIQLSVAPVFLLAGVGSFLNVCAARLARVIDNAPAERRCEIFPHQH